MHNITAKYQFPTLSYVLSDRNMACSGVHASQDIVKVPNNHVEISIFVLPLVFICLSPIPLEMIMT